MRWGEAHAGDLIEMPNNAKHAFRNKAKISAIGR